METTLETKIKVKDYGDMLAKIFDMELVAYQQYGSYQGDYLAVLNDKGIYKFYIGSYGSCSGCDWLEAEGETEYGEEFNYEVEYKSALEYCQQVTLSCAMPKKLWQSLSNEQKQMLISEDEWDATEMKEEIIKII